MIILGTFRFVETSGLVLSNGCLGWLPFFFFFWDKLKKKKKVFCGMLPDLSIFYLCFLGLDIFWGMGENDWWLLTWGWHWHVVISFSFHWLYFGSPNCRLGRLQDSNAVLSHFNEYSEYCFSEVSVEFSWNTRLLRSMKSDLDYIFQKLRYD